jgi:hypothetical protein
MLWKTHLRISREVMHRLRVPLSNAEFSMFKEGVIAPDKWNNYPHHYGKSSDIQQYLIAARGFYRRGDLINAYFNLGVALHYIQDSYTSVVSYNSPNRQTWHHNWEQKIEDSVFVSNFGADLEKTINLHLWNRDAERQRSLYLASMLCREANGMDQTLFVATLSGNQPSPITTNPTVDLNLGLVASYTVTKSVLSSTSNPSAEMQLRNILSRHQTLLLSTEIDTSNRIIGLIEERDRLKTQRIPPTGLISKIKNWITGTKINKKENAAISMNYYYASRKHLEEVSANYLNSANTAVAPHIGWYNLIIPPINIGIVKKDLLSISEVAGYLGANENYVRELLNKSNVPIYYLGNIELIRRPELNRILNQYPINGFKEYPA